MITSYSDAATGTMVEDPKGGGHFTEVILNPVFTVSDPAMKEKAIALHSKAHSICFIAHSVNFEVKNNPVCSGVA